MPSDMIEILYVCAQCGEKNTERLFAGTSIPAALNCPTCGAGRRYPNAQEAVFHKEGMFPVLPEPKQPRSRRAQGAQ